MRATIMPKAHDVRIADDADTAISDPTAGLADVPDGYRAMSGRRSLEMQIRP